MENLLDGGWSTVAHPEDLDRTAQKWQAALVTGEPYGCEVRTRTASGSYRWCLSRAVPLRDELGKIVKWFGTNTDIDERKKAEEKLQESEAYLAEAQRLSYTGSWAWIPATGDIRYWSEECYRVLGFDPHSGKPRFETFFQRIHPDDQAKVRETAETAGREKAEFELDYRIVHPGSVRWITPIINQPVPNAPGAPETGEYGLGDMQPTFFISPRKPGKLIWGVRPVFQLPTATNRYLGPAKLGAAPSIVALTQPGHWTLGVLANNVWSVAGSGSRPDVNQFLTQYFINYNLQKGWFIGLAPIITANWEASHGNVWTVPVGGGIGRITKFGAQPVSLLAQFYGNAVHPANAPSWTMRLQISFLFPKLSKEQKTMMLQKELKQLEQPAK